MASSLYSGCLTQEKIVAGCAKHFVVIADYRSVFTFTWKVLERGYSLVCVRCVCGVGVDEVCFISQKGL